MSLRTNAGLFVAALFLGGVAIVNCGSSNEVAATPSEPKPPPPPPGDPEPPTPRPGPTDTGDPAPKAPPTTAP